MRRLQVETVNLNASKGHLLNDRRHWRADWRRIWWSGLRRFKINIYQSLFHPIKLKSSETKPIYNANEIVPQKFSHNSETIFSAKENCANHLWSNRNSLRITKIFKWLDNIHWICILVLGLAGKSLLKRRWTV